MEAMVVGLVFFYRLQVEFSGSSSSALMVMIGRARWKEFRAYKWGIS